MKNGERNCNKIENGLAPKKWNKNLVNTSAPHFYDMRFGVCVRENQQKGVLTISKFFRQQRHFLHT